jgi:cytoskeleton protein RodZ
MPFLSAIVTAFAEIQRRNVLGTWQGFRNGVGMRVGSELKAARKKAGISVEVISKRTKIQVSKLVALEKNDVKNLPTGLYLFALVRAYAREVHINPEPIVEQLRAQFVDKDALDALHALDATGALKGKNSADPRRSKDEQPNPLRNAAIAAGVLLMAGAGAGAAAYVHNRGRNAHDVRAVQVEQSSAAPTHKSPGEAPSASLSSPAPTTTVGTVDVPQQAAGAAGRSAPTKTHKPNARTAEVKGGLPETVSTGGAVSEEPADRPANIEELTPEAPVLATAP